MAALKGVRDAFFGTAGTWTYFEDRDSGHLWLNPRPADTEIPGLYSQYYTHGGASAVEVTLWEQTMAYARHVRLGYPLTEKPDWKVRLLARMPTVCRAAEMDVLSIPATSKGRLLDFGCGDGTFMKRMRTLGWEVAGVEPDEKAVENLRTSFGFDVHSSLQVAEGWIGAFDMVVMNHVIEHVSSPLETLAKCARLLKPDGKLIVTTPNARSTGRRLFGKNWRGVEGPRHFNIFSSKSLSMAMFATDLEVKTLRTEVRLARGTFYTSTLAMLGHSCIELKTPQSKLLKLGGYAFQLMQAAVATVFKGTGEELFCVAVLARERS